MSNVIHLGKEREERTPHLSGTFKCGACKHEWVAVAPVGCYVVECPACGCMRGYSKSHVMAGEGSQIYICKICGSELFSLAQTGDVQCAGCGNHSNPWA